MGATSLATTFALAKQSAKGSGASTLYSLKLTDGMAFPSVTVEDTNDEFSGGTALVSNSAGQRLGVYTRISAAGRIRPDWFPQLLIGAGLGDVATTGTTPNFSHACTPSDDNDDYKWLSVYYDVDEGTANLARIVEDVRLSRLRITANRNAVPRFEVEGMGIHEEIAAGTETITAETGPVLTTVSGSITFNKSGGGAIAGGIRNCEIVIENTFPSPEDSMVIGATEMQDMEWGGMAVTGTVDAAFSKTAFAEMFYGGTSTAGTGYSLADVEGSLTLVMESAADIPTGAGPFTVTVAIPALVARAQEFRASGRNEVRLPIAFTAYKGAGELITVTVLNDTASY